MKEGLVESNFFALYFFFNPNKRKKITFLNIFFLFIFFPFNFLSTLFSQVQIEGPKRGEKNPH